MEDHTPLKGVANALTALFVIGITLAAVTVFFVSDSDNAIPRSGDLPNGADSRFGNLTNLQSNTPSTSNDVQLQSSNPGPTIQDQLMVMSASAPDLFTVGTPVNVEVLDSNGELQTIRVIDYNGHYIYQGDIIVGTSSSSVKLLSNVIDTVIDGQNLRWTSPIPYTISHTDSDIKGQIAVAILYFEYYTLWKFVARTTETDYIDFVDGATCSSWVGRQGGRQKVNLHTSCTQQAIQHEMLHVLGFYHEMSRQDRDAHIQINNTNVLAGRESYFDKFSGWSTDYGDFAFISLMMPVLTTMSTSATLKTMEVVGTLPTGISESQVGQWSALNLQITSSDSVTANKLYCEQNNCADNTISGWPQTGILDSEEWLISANRAYVMILQKNCNLVIFDGISNARSLVLSWQSATGDGYADCHLIMQDDGNLVIYSDPGNQNPIWDTSTHGQGTPPFKLVMQNNGDLVINEADGTEKWSSYNIT